MADTGKAKPTGWGRRQPNYEPSRKGSYYCRWRREERRKRVTERLKRGQGEHAG